MRLKKRRSSCLYVWLCIEIQHFTRQFFTETNWNTELLILFISYCPVDDITSLALKSVIGRMVPRWSKNTWKIFSLFGGDKKNKNRMRFQKGRELIICMDDDGHIHVLEIIPFIFHEKSGIFGIRWVPQSCQSDLVNSPISDRHSHCTGTYAVATIILNKILLFSEGEDFF